MEKSGLIEKSESFKKLAYTLEREITPVAVSGMISESFTHLVRALKSETDTQILILARDGYRAKKIRDDLEVLGVNAGIYLKKDIMFYDIEASSREYLYDRIKILRKLSEGKNEVVVASVEALFDKVDSPENFREYRIELKTGEEYELDSIVKKLVDIGYERVGMIEGKGQFAQRGGILDIFPVDFEDPVRIEFFDVEIDSIRIFDAASQRSKENIDRVTVESAEEIHLSSEDRESIKKNLEKKLKESEKKFSSDENLSHIYEKLKDKFLLYIEKLENGMSIDNKEMVIPFADRKFSGITEYLKEDSIVIFEDGPRTEESFRNYLENFEDEIKDYSEAGEVFPEHIDAINSRENVTTNLKKRKIVLTSNLMRTGRLFRVKEKISFYTKAIMNYQGDINLFKEDMEHQLSTGKKPFVFAENKEKAENLVQDMFNLGLEAVYRENFETPERGISVNPYTIPKGFEIMDTDTILIAYKDIFGAKKKKKRFKVKGASKIDSFTDLKIGDYVVHENHGIGKYKGVEQLNVQGVKKDYLIIEYSGSDKLYIPIDQMNLVQKYIGSDAERVKVNKLGSADWTRTKSRVRKSIEDMAEDLIKLYAEREVVKGHKYPEDTPWQNQFEEQFPYEETGDQLRAAEEIKSDMEEEKPMDRLLCGDVGYGKTEVALRAVFKAVMDNKQVAFLVPTTILAEQHYQTMKKRFENFPIKIGCLNRFRTPKEQERIKDALRQGNMDIVVGTHKLLSKSMKYKDLGLLIIDEEQRFGVKQKETIKELRKSVDVLTLTATPIPRTLHMSLSGIRDMSVLEEPPGERYPIQTYVVEFNENLIRDAVLKEMARGGQVYILYNKVRSMDRFTAEIQKLIPEARVASAHGQMGERRLEDIMQRFLENEYDVLVCTTIIETGLDIPNVNTIIITNADKMGLSQLYQLRGRVGRSSRIAFAYFMYEKDRMLTEVSEKRLKTIKEFTEFGSGFKIAMRDLEIRGAGNLLGAEQHGQMSAIGYDLYVKFLDEAIKKLQGKEEKRTVDTNIDLEVSGYIRDSYIKDEYQKIEVYKKISSIESREDMSSLIDELIDIYGDVSKEVMNLISISYIKNLAGSQNISAIKQTGKKVRFEYEKETDMPDGVFEWLIENCKGRVQFDMKKNPAVIYSLESSSEKEILKELIDFLENMSNFSAET